MGITVDNYFENLYSVIFSPKAFFEKNDHTISIRVAIANILLISSIAFTTKSIFESNILHKLFLGKLILVLLGVVITWFLTGLFFEYIAKIFNKGKKLNNILFLTSYAPLPYIFFAPLNLLKDFGSIGYFIGSYAEFFIYLWIIFLYALSLKSAYKLTIARAFMLIFLPFISIFFAIYWTICFCSKLWYIFSI
ncbi:MAG: hypothetical protein E7Z90_04965 [Cyanobacteria bacterium SIG29]|nr:hypothetical protein [Cyanobacteria bacterium SIG29]